MPRPLSTDELGKLTSATANIEHDLSSKQVLVAVDEVTVSVSADAVFKHGLVDF